MPNSHRIAFVILLSTATSLSCDKNMQPSQPADGVKSTQTAGTNLETLIAAEHAIMRSISTKNTKQLENLLTPDFVLHMPGKPEMRKPEFLQSILAIPATIESIRGVDMAARHVHEVGIVTGIQEATVRLNDGSVVLSRTAFTDVFTRVENRWQLHLASSVELK